MSFFKPKVANQTSAPAPAPIQAQAKRLELEGQSERSRTKSKSKGRSALRIDLQPGGAVAGGTGINIPQS